MRVLDEPSKGLQRGDRVVPEVLGLPVAGAGGLLIVFWKER